MKDIFAEAGWRERTAAMHQYQIEMASVEAHRSRAEEWREMGRQWAREAPTAAKDCFRAAELEDVRADALRARIQEDWE